MKLRKLIIVGLALSASLVSVAQANSEKYQKMEAKAKALIAQMTLQEKADQMMNGAPGIDRLGIKPYNWWSEALHGVARNGVATSFPEPIGLGATFDPTLVQVIGDAVSSEGRAKFAENQKIQNYGQYAGLTYWAPNVNIFRDPRWGRGMETYGEDPFLSGCLGTAYVKGIQGADPFYLKAAACAKHFAVHSGPERLRHEFDVHPSARDLYETYLPAFQMLVQDGNVEAVMGAYNRVYSESASAHPLLLTEILRNKWGFKGHVVSDCGAISDIRWGHKIAKSDAEAAAIAIKGGLNLECGSMFHALPEAVKQGLVTEAEVDAALLPLVMTKLKLGIIGFDPECPYNDIPSSEICSPEHADLAKKAALESMVLLKNDGVLPIKKDTKSIYVLGPSATDVFSMMGNYYGVSNHYTSYLQGITSKAGLGTSVNYKQGFLISNEPANPHNWSYEGKWSDVCIVFVGNNGNTEGEEGDAISSPLNGDRDNLLLPESQLKFLRELSKDRRSKLVAVITGGSPVDMTEISKLCDAVVYAWYPGQEGGEALGELLFGEASFSGRLPITFPTNTEALPAFEDYSMDGRTYKYMSEGIMYPFGYGLTYGKIVYSEAKMLNKKYKGKENLKMQVTIANESNEAVTEVAQVYLTAPMAGKATPLQSLVAFKRVEMPANSSKVVEFEIDAERLKMVQHDGALRLMKGDYKITVAGAAPSARTTELGVSSTELTFKL